MRSWDIRREEQCVLVLDGSQHPHGSQGCPRLLVSFQHPKKNEDWFLLGDQGLLSPHPLFHWQWAPAETRVSLGPLHPAWEQDAAVAIGIRCGMAGGGRGGTCCCCRGNGMWGRRGMLWLSWEWNGGICFPGQGQGPAAAQPTMELLIPFHFSTIIYLSSLVSFL